MPRDVPKDRLTDVLACQTVTLDILRNVLSRADTPSEFGGYFARQLRELTGTKLMVMVRHTYSSDEVEHQIIESFPRRRRHGPNEVQLLRLATESFSEQEPAVWTSSDGTGASAEILASLGYGTSLVVPLTIANHRVGALLLLGLPEECRVQEALAVIDPLASVIAALLRTHVAYGDMEAVVQRRTRELRESERKHRRLVENLQEGIWVVDREFRTTFVNPRMTQMLVRPAEEILGEPLVDFLCEEAAETGQRILDHLRAGKTAMYEVDFLKRDGERIHTSLQAVPIYDSAEQFDGAQAVVVDITRRKRAEKAIEAARQAAEAANRSKSDFLANMSHEIRTPMTAILGFADILTGDPTREEVIEAAQTIKRNGQHLLDIINDILDLSKIEAGKMDLARIVCSPAQIAADVKGLMQVRADAKRLSLEVEYDGPLPERICTDPTRLRQILVNLVGNSVKFTEIGGVCLTVGFVDGEEQMLHFDVVDTGIGMTPNQTRGIFAPFTQADTSTARQFGGTGLGLTLSKRYAQMLGGDLVLVSSQPEVGTHFRVTIAVRLPENAKLVDQPELLSSAGREREPRGAEADEQLRGRVLLAEDGPDNQRFISFVLKKAGADVTVVENGQQAVEAVVAAGDCAAGDCAAGDRHFDVILMDMQMPVLDGYDATRALRELGYDGPIIALTAHAMTTDRDKCLQAGCNDFASKPIDRRSLTALIARYLRRADPKLA